MRRIVLGMMLAAGFLACSSDNKPEGQAAPMTGGSPLDLGNLTMTVPDGWQSQEPSSRMRHAQYLLPGQGGAAEDAELVVFYFGAGNAGSVEANLERWRGQMKGAEGDTEKVTVNGMLVTTLDVSGSYAESMGPMMQAGETKPNYRMIASIVESPAGAYYFKLTGPGQTVAHWEPSFAQFVNSAKGS